MSNKGNAYVIAVALYGKDQQGWTEEDLADGLYNTIDVLGFGSDERKADLYAQLAELLKPDTTFVDAQRIVEAAMNNTDKVVGRG